MQLVENIGYEALEKEILKKWTCPECGKLLSAHRKYCVVCGHLNYNFPIEEN
jgi:rubrerythrin